YRDFYVDHLICCDRRMVLEAQQNNYDGTIYTRPDWVAQFTPAKVVPDLPYSGTTRLDNPWHWGSGPFAVLLGAKLATNEVHMVGFDLYSETNTVNNIYKGTGNYEGTDTDPVDPSYWLYQINKVFENYPEIMFHNYNNKQWPTEQKNVCNKMLIEFEIANETA
ncbi:uncharacterized protein METZ01_LOCUS92060, partial [marine metagenome]